MPKRLFAFMALVLAAVACNWSDVAPPAAPIIEPSALPTFVISTLTAIPTQTSLPEATSTPDAPIAWPKDLGVNCRFGPGAEWEVVSNILPDTITEINGRTVNTKWWYVSDPMHDGEFCWVAYDVMDTAGNLNIVPIVDPPTATVSAITADSLVTFSACGGSNQVTFNGTITANGLATVTYHWEVSGDAQTATPDETIQFTEAGTRKITDNSFSADCGDYAARLVVISPNETSIEKAFKIQAP